jgi:alkylation response protein AidB-like acyl-CoA dehydrogenase
VSSSAAIELERGAEQQEITALARALAGRELGPRSEALDERRAGALHAAWAPITEIGFDRALLAADQGGVELEAGALLPILEELAAGDAGVALILLLSIAALAALPPERAAESEPHERWALVPAPPGELATPARLSISRSGNGGPTLSGTLAPALGALSADGLVVMAPGAEPRLFAVPATAAGIEVAGCSAQLGLRSAAAARISLSGAAAGPASGSGGAATLALLRAGAAAIARGVARRARELAIAYARERMQGGVPIIEHDAVRTMLAAMTTRDPGPPPTMAAVDPAAALTAKVTATEAALATATDAVQVFGGTGYMRETGVEKLMRDAKYLQLWPEPNWLADGAIVDAALDA